MDKTNSNHIGYFHQNIFRHISDEWSVPKQGFDLVNEEKHIYVEMKNKHNTMNSSSAQKTYIKMQSMLLKSAENRCFLVEVIAKKSQNSPWKISLDGVPHTHEYIRRVSMELFYEMVTGDADAFRKLCEVLPMVLDDVVNGMDMVLIENSVFEELKALSPNLLKSLFVLSFGRYEGFERLALA